MLTQLAGRHAVVKEFNTRLYTLYLMCPQPWAHDARFAWVENTSGSLEKKLIWGCADVLS